MSTGRSRIRGRHAGPVPRRRRSRSLRWASWRLVRPRAQRALVAARPAGRGRPPPPRAGPARRRGNTRFIRQGRTGAAPSGRPGARRRRRLDAGQVHQPDRDPGRLGRSVLAGIWMALAHTVGSVARIAGQSARDLDPVHRRDGVGLTALCAAIIAAAATWWHVTGPVKPVEKFLVAFFGSGAWTVPLLLALLAWRFLRHPDNNAATARMVIGWSALRGRRARPGPHRVRHAAVLRRPGGHQVRGRPDRRRGLHSAGGPGHQVGRDARAGPGLRVRTAGDHRHAAAPGPGAARRAARVAPADPADAAATADRRRGRRRDRPGPLRLGRKKAEAIEAGARDRAYDSPLLAATIKAKAAEAGSQELAAGDVAAEADPVADALVFSGWARRRRRAGNAAAEAGWHEDWFGAAEAAARRSPRRPRAGRASPSSSRSPRRPTPATPCRRSRCSSRAPCRGRGPGPTTPSSRRCPRCSTSSRWTRRSPGSPAGRR